MMLMKVNKWLVYILSFLLIIDAADSYYAFVIFFINNNFTPAYGLWTQYFIETLILLILLQTKRFAILVYLYVIFISVQYITDFWGAPILNPLFWIHQHRFGPLFFMALDGLEFIMSVVGLLTWLQSRRFRIFKA